MPYWHSTHAWANVVGFLISSPRPLLIRKRVCIREFLRVRPLGFPTAAVWAKASRSKLLELWYQAGSHHWYTGGLPENALWFADAEISTHLISSAKKMGTDFIVLMFRLLGVCKCIKKLKCTFQWYHWELRQKNRIFPYHLFNRQTIKQLSHENWNWFSLVLKIYHIFRSTMMGMSVWSVFEISNDTSFIFIDFLVLHKGINILKDICWQFMYNSCMYEM